VIIYFVLVSLSLVYVGGWFFDTHFVLSMTLAGFGAAALGLLFATQERMLQRATAPRHDGGND
jgi:uncharacterized membrane protein